MDNKKGWLLLVIVLIVTVAIGYAFSSQSSIGSDLTNDFFDYLSGTYRPIQPVE